MSVNWKDECNYWRVKDKTGKVIANIIKVDGQLVEVNDKVYAAYAKSGRRERYVREKEAGLLLSLEKMQSDELELGFISEAHVPSAEDEYLAAERVAEKKRLIAKLPDALSQLPEKEQELQHLLYWKKVSLRQIARKWKIALTTLHDKEQKILLTLRKMLVS